MAPATPVPMGPFFSFGGISGPTAEGSAAAGNLRKLRAEDGGPSADKKEEVSPSEELPRLWRELNDESAKIRTEDEWTAEERHVETVRQLEKILRLNRRRLDSLVQGYRRKEPARWPRPRDVSIAVSAFKEAQSAYRRYVEDLGIATTLPKDASKMSAEEYWQLIEPYFAAQFHDFENRVFQKSNVLLSNGQPTVNREELEKKVSLLERSLLNQFIHGQDPGSKYVRKLYTKLAQANYQLAYHDLVSVLKFGNDAGSSEEDKSGQLEEVRNRYLNIVKSFPLENEPIWL
jgi:hypothetical protein